MTRQLGMLAVAASIAFTLGCGSTDGGTGDSGGTGGGGGGTGGDAAPTAAEVCQAASDRVAQLAVTCLHANPSYVAAHLGGTLAAGCAEQAKSIAAGRSAYDATQGAACKTALPSMTCQDMAGGAMPAPCRAALAGNVANGGSCYGDLDCQSGRCGASTATCPGTCASGGAAGAACAVADECAVGLECAPVTRVCRAPAGVGSACPCQGGLWCDPSAGGDGTCKAPLATGAACASDAACGIGSVCVGTTTPICRSQVDLGGSCAGSTTLCGPGYVCTGGYCTEPPGLGQGCSTFCSQGYCDFAFANPTCKPLVANGQACVPAQGGMECASGYCGPAGLCAPASCNAP